MRPRRTRRAQLSLSLALTTLCAAAPAAAAEERAHALSNTGAGFLALETLGSVVVFAGYSIAAGDAPERCSWCAANGFDDGVRDALRMKDPKPAGLASHVLSLGVVPIGSFVGVLVPALADGHGSYAWKDGWIMVNAFLLTTGLADGTKKLVARQRPSFHYGVQGATEAKGSALEEHLSFFSGDTAWAFTMASSATTLAYLHGYESAPYIAVAGGTLALATGALRVAADMHWASDVLVGALVGTSVGVALPLLLHGRKKATTVSVLPLVGPVSGAMLTGSF